MGIEKYDPKLPLSYLAMVSEFLHHYGEFQNPSHIVKWFGVDYVTDVTDTPERESLKSIGPLPKDFHERAFQFRESEKRRGIMETAFHKNRLVNLRATMYFYGWFPRTAASKFFLRELYPAVSAIIGSQGTLHDLPYTGFYWSNFGGLTVRVGCHRELGYVSAFITDMDYLTYF